MPPPLSVRVLVVNLEGKPIDDATVTLTSSGPSATTSTLFFDAYLRQYTGTISGPGTYRFDVSRPNAEPQTRAVELPSPRPHHTFVLAQPGLDFYYRGTVRVPFQNQNLLAVAVQ